MKIYDLSPEISEDMVVYMNKAEKKPRIRKTRSLKEGANESRIEMDSHTGSHVDAPRHVLGDGKTIDSVPLDKFMGECIMLDLTSKKGSIDSSCLLTSMKHTGELKGKIILLKTKPSHPKEFDFDFTYLEKSGAEFLASMKIKAVGIDSPGIERNQPGHETHRILLERGILIFEGLDMSGIKSGEYFFYGFPLKIRKGDASPVRAVLVEK